MDAHTNYLLYFDSEDIDINSKLDELSDEFGADNVQQLNSSTCFVVKVESIVPFAEVQNRAGFCMEEGTRGIIVEMLSGHRNGWYSRDFWDFLKIPLSEENNQNKADAR